MAADDINRMIWYDEVTSAWHLQCEEAEYVFGYRDGAVAHLGFGPIAPGLNLWARAERPALRPALGSSWGALVSECTYTLSGEERAAELELLGYEVKAPELPTLEVVLRDQRYQLEIALLYELHADLGIVTRSQRVTNVGSSVAVLTNLPSFRLRCCGGEHVLESLYGDHMDECHFQATPLPVGVTLLENRTGRHFEHSPWYALRVAEEYSFGSLAYSGTWVIEFRRDITGGTTITGGPNPRQFTHRLAPGETVQSPSGVLGFAAGDSNCVSLALAGYQRQLAIAAGVDRQPPVVFDHYFPFHPDSPNEERLRSLAERAAAIGCEVFLLDAGWHVNEAAAPATNWIDQRGDWDVDPHLFSAGAGSFVSYVLSQGMKFGIWMEPESVQANARVVTEHPDWVHRRNGQPLVNHVVSKGDTYVLRLGLPAVQQWLIYQVVRVVNEFDASWLKWDFNSELWAGDDSDGHDEVLGHIEGLYHVRDRIRAEFPRLVLENCASGGGRLDFGGLAHTHFTSMTDMMSPVQELGIRFGSSRAFSPHSAINWLVHWPRDWHWMSPNEQPFIDSGFAAVHGDLDFRARIAMMGAFGISAPLDLWDDDDLQRVAHHIVVYKKLRPLLCYGRSYRLTVDPPRDGTGDWAATCTVARDGSEAVLFAYRLSDGATNRRFAIPGLAKAAVYTIEDDDRGELVSRTGEWLGGEGIECVLDHPFRSVLCRIRVNAAVVDVIGKAVLPG